MVWELSHPKPSGAGSRWPQAQKVLVKAVTRVDGTARAQTVSREQNPRLFQLLTSFKAKSGLGVPCNTSLNFNGTGFINRVSFRNSQGLT
nr:carbamoyltransferase C-terminal domain-containing protein [Mesorhizobium sp. LSJC264A00]